MKAFFVCNNGCQRNSLNVQRSCTINQDVKALDDADERHDRKQDVSQDGFVDG